MNRFRTDLRMGVDVGGTKVEGVVLRRLPGQELAELARVRVPTQRERGYESIVETVAGLIERMVREASLDLATLPIGVGMPGGVRRDGCIKNSNTTCLNGRPFRGDLSARLGKELVFENDANCFALAETLLGAGAPWSDGVVFGVIVGTGVGGGLVVGGKLWPGPQGIAGEWGHHVVHSGVPDSPDADAGDPRACYCGKRGCVEAYVCGPAVQADYLRRSGIERPVDEIVAARGTDVHARASIERFLDAFARGLANVINIVDPSAIILGGGLSNIELLYREGAEMVARYVFNEELTTPILKNRLGDSAGVLGAALLPDASLLTMKSASRR